MHLMRIFEVMYHSCKHETIPEAGCPILRGYRNLSVLKGNSCLRENASKKLDELDRKFDQVADS